MNCNGILIVSRLTQNFQIVTIFGNDQLRQPPCFCRKIDLFSLNVSLAALIIKLVLLFGCSLILIMAVGLSFIRNKSQANVVLIALTLICGVWSYFATVGVFELNQLLPHLNKAYLPFLAMTGPLWLRYNQSLFFQPRVSQFEILHIVPALLCLLLSMPFYLQTSEFKREYVETLFYDLPTMSIYLATRLAEITTIVYVMVTLRLLWLIIDDSGNSKSRSRAAKVMFWISSAALFAALMRTGGSVIDLQLFSVKIPCLIILFTFGILYCFIYYDPSLAGLQFKSSRLSSSVQARSDTKQKRCLVEDISNKIVEQELYLDPDITIAGLGKKLQIQPHRLSELINTNTHSNFKCFINSFRIEHAKRLLLEEPNATITDIAYAVGFNSNFSNVLLDRQYLL